MNKVSDIITKRKRSSRLGYTYKAKMNEDKIFNYLLEHRQGVQVNELVKNLKISRQTVHETLDRLVEANLVIKSNKHLYYVKDLDIVFRRVYSKFLNNAAKILLNTHLVIPTTETDKKQQHPLGIIPPDSENIELAKSNIGFSPSTKFCSPANIKLVNDIEKQFFEFANRIGAFILYTFIESTRPNDSDNTKIANNPIKEAERRYSLSRKFIHDSIDINSIYERFLNMISDMNFSVKSYDTKNKMSTIKWYSGQSNETRFMSMTDFDTSQYKRLFDTFEEIYPKIYQSIEKYLETQSLFFGNELDTLESMFKVRVQCDHDWKDIRIYRKSGIFHQCAKCRIIANEYIFNQLQKKSHKSRK